MSIKAIVWDIGGVLLRSASFENRVPLEKKFNMSSDELSSLIFGKSDNFRSQLGEISSEAHNQNIAATLSLSMEETAQLLVDFFAKDFLDFGLVEEIRQYKKSYVSAVLSNYDDTLRNNIENVWKINDAFQKLFISSEIGLMKPGKEIYQFLIEALALHPEEIVFIDDFIENVEGAIAVGMHAIHFQSPQQTHIALNKLLEKF
jgi:glucose-1-phosphatase